MAKRNTEGVSVGAGRTPNGRVRPNTAVNKQASPSKRAVPNSHSPPSPTRGQVVTQRLSPSRAHAQRPLVSPPPGGLPSSPRVSPGLAAGHYAGCKWTEPPSPSTLPLPPQHWMQAMQGTRPVILPFRAPSAQCDIAQQLKVLLKVHA